MGSKIEDHIPVIEGFDEEETHSLVSPPLILDNIDHEQEIYIRDYANNCRHLYNAAKARNIISTGNAGDYPTEINQVIDKYKMDQEKYDTEVLTELMDDLGDRISMANKQTLERKFTKKEDENIGIIVHVTEICEKFNEYVDNVADEINGIDPLNISIKVNTPKTTQ